MIAFLSQLTHCIAITLMTCNDSTHLKDYTGDSFRDLTRIAKINETLWSELFFENKDNLLVPGDFVNVKAVSKEPIKYVVVPQVSVSDSTNGTYVWVVDDKNVAQQRFVKIANQNGEEWIVTDGLEPNETVIIAGFMRLRPGTVVAPVDKDAVKTQKEKKD